MSVADRQPLFGYGLALGPVPVGIAMAITSYTPTAAELVIYGVLTVLIVGAATLLTDRVQDAREVNGA